MLGDKEVAATIAVKDIEVARKFYEEKVGLTPERSEEPSVQSYKSGDSRILVYESQFAGTNKATAVTWPVSDVEREVQVLKDRGVVFEHYDLPGTTHKGDVHVAGDRRVAWFKDPDGNILAIVNR